MICYGSLKIDWAMGFSRYGTRWRNMRREFHRYFHPTASQQYRPIEVKATHELIRRLLDTPSEFLEHIRLYVSVNLIMYDRLQPFDCPFNPL